MIAQLANVSIEMLQQLSAVSLQLEEGDYSKPLDLLSGNTIGKHIRHVYELYDELLLGLNSSTVNYDARKRNLQIEKDPIFAGNFAADLAEKLLLLEYDAVLHLKGSYGRTSDVIVNTSIGRELAYNIEHSIHHMAIIQICLKHHFSYVKLNENFGVAFSTQNHLKNVHANLSA